MRTLLAAQTGNMRAAAKHCSPVVLSHFTYLVRNIIVTDFSVFSYGIIISWAFSYDISVCVSAYYSMHGRKLEDLGQCNKYRYKRITE